MQVIKNGRFAEKQETLCSFCGCEFIFGCDDLRWTEDGDSASVLCPQCKQICKVVAEREYRGCKPCIGEIRLL